MFKPIKHIKNISRGLTDLGKKKGENHILDEHIEAAKRSKDAYLHPDERTGKGYVRHLSNDEIAVYHNNGKTDVSIRGTKSKDYIKTDLYLASGNLKKSARYQRNKAHLDKVRKVLGPINELSGHSLGGALAHTLGDNHKGSKAVSFNPGAGITGAYGKKKGTIYSSDGDSVSALSMSSSKHDIRILPSGSDDILGRHSINNFQ